MARLRNILLIMSENSRGLDDLIQPNMRANFLLGLTFDIHCCTTLGFEATIEAYMDGMSIIIRCHHPSRQSSFRDHLPTACSSDVIVKVCVFLHLAAASKACIMESLRNIHLSFIHPKVVSALTG
jgi:hypothetical protein